MTELPASASLMEVTENPSLANMHPNINFGERNVALGLNSPTVWERLDYGKPIGVGYGLLSGIKYRMSSLIDIK